MNNQISKRLSFITNEYVRILEEKMDEIGITLIESHIIKVLHFNEGINVKHIGEELRLTKRIIEHSLSSLNDKNLIRVIENEEEFYVYLTQEAEGLYPKIKRITNDMADSLVNGIDRKESEAVVRILDQILDNLDDMNK